MNSANTLRVLIACAITLAGTITALAYRFAPYGWAYLAWLAALIIGSQLCSTYLVRRWGPKRCCASGMTPGAYVYRWTGILAELNTPSGDGRVLALKEHNPLRFRSLPLPLLRTVDDHDMASVKDLCGTIDSVWITGTELRGSGYIEIDPTATWGHGLLDGGKLPVGITVDNADPVDPDHDNLVIANWRLVGATIQDHAVWPTVAIELCRSNEPRLCRP